MLKSPGTAKHNGRTVYHKPPRTRSAPGRWHGNNQRPTQTHEVVHAAEVAARREAAQEEAATAAASSSVPNVQIDSRRSAPFPQRPLAVAR